MSLLHLSFYSALTLRNLGLAFRQTHLISTLLCLGRIVLSIYIALPICSDHIHNPNLLQC
uniref:Uncharacterized protein n=1 Tax=Melopsittacus undulatus TaxID=13146 RepID=A0A8C6JWR0_MELUD